MVRSQNVITVMNWMHEVIPDYYNSQSSFGNRLDAEYLLDLLNIEYWWVHDDETDKYNLDWD